MNLSFVVAPPTAQAMAAAALRLLEEEGLASRLTRRAREESRKFSWETACDEWVSLYYGLAQSKAAGRLPAAEESVRRRSEA